MTRLSAEHPDGVSVEDFARTIGRTYGAALYMIHRLQRVGSIRATSTWREVGGQNRVAFWAVVRAETD